MPTKRPLRANTTEAALRAVANVASGPLKPPRHLRLRRGDRPFWDAVIKGRARDEWTEADLVLAAQLARCMADSEAEAALLSTEGYIRTGGAANPRAAIVASLQRRGMAIMRSLRMTGRVSGDTRDLMAMRRLERQAAQAHQEVVDEDDGLLA